MLGHAGVKECAGALDVYINSGGGDEAYSSKTAHDTVEVEPLAATYIFGSSEVEIKEEVHIPAMAGLDQ